MQLTRHRTAPLTLFLALGFVFLAGPGLAERPAGTRAEKWSERGKSLERSADAARERGNAQWQEGSTRGQERAEEVRRNAQETVTDQQKKLKERKEKVGKDLDEAKVKAKSKAKHEAEARRARVEKEMNDQHEEMQGALESASGEASAMSEVAKGRVGSAERAVDQAADGARDKLREGAAAAEREGQSASDKALSNARPKGEARGFWSRLFGGDESD